GWKKGVDGNIRTVTTTASAAPAFVLKSFFTTVEQLARHVASARKQAYIVLHFAEHANERARIVLYETIRKRRRDITVECFRKYCILSSVYIKNNYLFFQTFILVF